MTGEALYSRRSSRDGDGVERFYSAPAIRRQNNLMHQAQRAGAGEGEGERAEQHRGHEQKQLNLGPTWRSVVGPGSVSGSNDGKSGSSTSSATTTNKKVENLTNLDRFIEHTTPRVAVQLFPKTSTRELRNRDGEIQSYFVLGDLWEFFKEWSAYGAGVPLIFNGSDSVVQYYVPYLSGIQLYVDPSSSVIRQQRPGEVSDIDSSRETSSDDSVEFGADGGTIVPPGASMQQNCAGAMFEEPSSLSLISHPFRGLSVDENKTNNCPSILVFEYMERSQPYGREPLANKISNLEAHCPALKTYRSCDLTSASWFSVAWYPIYRIPMGPTLQSLDACFLTYHSLSTPLSSTSTDWHRPLSSTVVGRKPDTGVPLKLSLPSFALASYKFKVSFWNFSGEYETPKFNKLAQAADNWLKMLQVNHPDYMFFVSHNPYW